MEFLHKNSRARSRTIKFGLNVRMHGTPRDNCLYVDYILTRNGTGVAGVCGGEKSSSFYLLTGLYPRVLFTPGDNTLELIRRVRKPVADKSFVVSTFQ